MCFLILKCYVFTDWKQTLSRCIFQTGAHCHYGSKPWICRLFSPLLRHSHLCMISANVNLHLKNMGTLLSSLPHAQSGVCRDAFVSVPAQLLAQVGLGLWQELRGSGVILKTNGMHIDRYMLDVFGRRCHTTDSSALAE